jgi:hypothetical protein
MLDYAALILALLLDWIAKGFVILGLAFLADLLLRRANASLRHLIWLVGLAAVMLLPVVSRMLPSLDVPLFHLDFLAANPAPEGGLAQVGSEVGFGWSTSEILLGIYVAGSRRSSGSRNPINSGKRLQDRARGRPQRVADGSCQNCARN